MYHWLRGITLSCNDLVLFISWLISASEPRQARTLKLLEVLNAVYSVKGSQCPSTLASLVDEEGRTSAHSKST